MSDERGIEGVLSSIRRLVAEDEETSRTPGRAEPLTRRVEPPVPQKRPQAMMLTPAAQVPAAKPPQGDEPPARDGFDQPIFKQSKSERRMARRGRESSHAVTRPVAEPLTLRDPVSRPGTEGAGDRSSPLRPHSAPLILTAAEVVRPGSIPLPVRDAEALRDAPVPDGLDDKVAALENAVAEMSAAQITKTLAEDVAPKIVEAVDLPEPAVEPSSEMNTAAVSDRPAPISPQPAAAPMAVSAPEPGAVPVMERAPVTVSESAPASAAVTDMDADRNMLGETVREVLIQELEGELGERITRNLRTMIQREIRIALGDAGK